MKSLFDLFISRPAMSAETSEKQHKQWQKDNQETIDALNAYTDEHGLFSDTFRPF